MVHDACSDGKVCISIVGWFLFLYFFFLFTEQKERQKSIFFFYCFYLFIFPCKFLLWVRFPSLSSIDDELLRVIFYVAFFLFYSMEKVGLQGIFLEGILAISLGFLWNIILNCLSVLYTCECDPSGHNLELKKSTILYPHWYYNC